MTTLKMLAVQRIEVGDVVVVDETGSQVRPAYQGETPRARAVEAIGKGELAIVDLISGMIKRAPVR